MDTFDDQGIFFSDDFNNLDNTVEVQASLRHKKRKFKDFLRQYHEGNFNYKYRFAFLLCYSSVNSMIRDLMYLYRDNLKRNYNLGKYFLEVYLDDLRCFDDSLADEVTKRPSEHLPLVTSSFSIEI